MATLIPYETAKIMNDMRHFMENLWQRSMDLDVRHVLSNQWLPAVDIEEEYDKFFVTADLPGVDPKDIEISLENNMLILKGKREESFAEKKGTFYRKERMQGKFYRQIALPTTAESKHIIAKSKYGVLEITIPKKDTAEVTKIHIKVEE